MFNQISKKKKTKNHWKNVEKVRGKVKRNQFGLGLFGSLSLSFFFCFGQRKK